jgi:tRNA(Ile2) C34 agmatinyltransferase TiaS
MRNVLRRLFHSHKWDAVEVKGEKGWKCRNCGEFLSEREYIERIHDSDREGPKRAPWMH